MPTLAIPANAGGSLTLRVTDSITGRIAETAIAVQAARPAMAAPAPAVTVYRGDRIHAWLNQGAPITVVSQAAGISFNRSGERQVGNANAAADEGERWANEVVRGLKGSGIQDQFDQCRRGQRPAVCASMDW